MNSPHDELHQLRDFEMEDFANPFLGFAQDGQKFQIKDNTSAFQPNAEEEFDGEWKSNILISSTESKQRSPFALRHLTSFEERSMDNHGKKLSDTFKHYVCWLRRVEYEPESSNIQTSLSNLDWETVEGHISDLMGLTDSQKKTLISAAHKNTQAELILSEIIEQIPQDYYLAAFSLAAFLVQDFKNSYLSGSQQQQIINYVNQTFLIQSSKIYDRLFHLGLADETTKNHEKYFSFVKSWMEVFYLSLNGYLQNPLDRRTPLDEMPNGFSQLPFGKKPSNFS